MKSEVAVDSTTVIRKSRASKGVTEAYYFVLALAWNDIISLGTEMTALEQEESIKAKGAEWASALTKEYPDVPLKPDVTLEILNEEISTDNGNGMIRKAKEMICYVTNVLNPVWKEPDIPVEEALSDCRKVAWLRNEEDRKRKKKLVPPYDKADRPYDTTWRSKEWLAFRYLGLPAGKSKCLQIFQCGALSGPFAIKKYCFKRNFPTEGEYLQSKSTSSSSGGLITEKSEEDVKPNVSGTESPEKILPGMKEIIPSKHALWREEKERLETLIKLSEQLKLPAEVNRTHLLDLYNFLLTPIVVRDDVNDRKTKIQKLDHDFTPISADEVVSTTITLTSEDAEEK